MSKTIRWLAIILCSLWIVWTFLDDLAQFHSSPVLKPDGFGPYVFSIAASLVGLVFPLLLVLSLYRWVKRFRNLEHTTTTVSQSGDRWMLALAAGILILFYLVERVIPVSVVPFGTSASAVLFAAIGSFLTRGSRFGFRIAALCGGVLLILSMRFLDSNSRKPFLRDLYHVRIGMTINEVERMMGGYLHRSESEGENGELKDTDRIIFRPSRGSAYNADFGVVILKDGRVKAVGFSAD